MKSILIILSSLITIDCKNTSKTITLINSNNQEINSNGWIEDDLITILEHCQVDSYKCIVYTENYTYTMIIVKSKKPQLREK